MNCNPSEISIFNRLDRFSNSPSIPLQFPFSSPSVPFRARTRGNNGESTGNRRGIEGESKGNLRLPLSRCFQFITSFSPPYLLFPGMSLKRRVTRPHFQDTERPRLQEFSAVNSHFAPPVGETAFLSGGNRFPRWCQRARARRFLGEAWQVFG